MSTSLLIFVSNGLPALWTETSMTYDRPTAVNHNSPVSCLPKWVAKKIEAVGADVSSRQQT
jgi:hypothetical protein